MRRVAAPGTGIMGAGMVGSLLQAGLDVTRVKQGPGRAGPLAADGARVAATAAEEITGCSAGLRNPGSWHDEGPWRDVRLAAPVNAAQHS